MNLTKSQKSSALFVFVCMPVRLAVTYLAYTGKARFLPYLTLLVGIGFLYIYFSGSRKTGAETFGQPIWWNDMRPIHGLLYIAYSILALNKCKNAWMLLGVDAAIGFGAFIQNKSCES
jgi:Na+-transporting methylmalonyl-CoA/oxaloacetate decarboxylase beta subunit